MGRVVLLNPFSSTTEQVHRAQSSEQSSSSTPVCFDCKSDDIVTHAVAQWSNEAQEWQLAETFNKQGYCHRCNRPCEIAWVPFG